MPASKSANNRSSSGAPGVKVLITAASFAATIGGWAMLSNQEGFSSATSTPAPASTQPTLSVELLPLPTLVPPLDPKSLVIKVQPIAPGTPRQSAPAQAAAAPAPQISGLRVVGAPSIPSGGIASNRGGGSVNAAPPPSTTTGSSKP